MRAPKARPDKSKPNGQATRLTCADISQKTLNEGPSVPKTRTHAKKASIRQNNREQDGPSEHVKENGEGGARTVKKAQSLPVEGTTTLKNGRSSKQASK